MMMMMKHISELCGPVSCFIIHHQWNWNAVFSLVDWKHSTWFKQKTTKDVLSFSSGLWSSQQKSNWWKVRLYFYSPSSQYRLTHLPTLKAGKCFLEWHVSAHAGCLFRFLSSVESTGVNNLWPQIEADCEVLLTRLCYRWDWKFK